MVEEVGGGLPAEGLLEEEDDFARGELGFVGDAEDGGVGFASCGEDGLAQGDYAEVELEAIVVSCNTRIVARG